MRKYLLVFSTIFILGTILGTLGTVSFPIGTNMSYFWPAAVLQSVAGIFFGWWGVAAATLFPSLSNALTDGSMTHIVGLIPANFIQSALPLYMAKKLRMSPYLTTKRDALIFCIFCAILPHIFGGIVGCSTLYLLGDIPNKIEFFTTLKVWLIGNIPCSLIFGLLLLKFVTPVLKDSELLHKGILNEAK